MPRRLFNLLSSFRSTAPFRPATRLSFCRPLFCRPPFVLPLAFRSRSPISFPAYHTLCSPHVMSPCCTEVPGYGGYQAFRQEVGIIECTPDRFGVSRPLSSLEVLGVLLPRSPRAQHNNLWKFPHRVSIISSSTRFA